MKIALIGLPQAGKKTLFHLLTGKRPPEARRPGEVLEGMASIGDERVDALASVCAPRKVTYAQNHFVLCPDASSGSYEWLSAARRCQLVCIVARAFESAQIYHPDGSVDPVRDCDNLEAELLLADMEIAETRLARLEKESRIGLDKDKTLEMDALFICLPALQSGERLADVALEPHLLAAISSLDFVTMLPLLRVYNVSEDELDRDFGERVLNVSCQIEQEIMEMDPAEREEYLHALGVTASGLDRVNQAAYEALGLMSFYTAGDDECRAWTIPRGALAPVAAGKIHSDIERGFIRAEVIKLDDYVHTGSEAAAKAVGKFQTRGRDYIVEDGDVVHFLFNV